MPLERLLEECRTVTGSDAHWTWVASDVLLGAGLDEWLGVPLWIASPEWKAANRVVVDRAVASGLRFRPLAETIRATLADAQRVEGVGLEPERERELLSRYA
jgi:2'-hydroxyisoflavone reductase